MRSNSSQVIRLRILLSAGLYGLIAGPEGALAKAESLAGISYDITEKDHSKLRHLKMDTPILPNRIVPGDLSAFEDVAETALALHVFIMGVIYYTFIGEGTFSHVVVQCRAYADGHCVQLLKLAPGVNIFML
jgi:hypothetical protein